MVKGVPTISPRMHETTILGEVPTCVINPPRRAPKAMGMRKVEGETLERRANWKATGIMIANAPTFFTKAERTVTRATSTASCSRTLLISGRKR